MKSVIISAAASGHGKTTVALGLMRAYTKRGLKVQPFKVGPDYIDPAFHKAATGRPSVNLDGWLLGEESDEKIKELVEFYSRDADLALIEGVMGLYDGAGYDPMDGSTGWISKVLDSPVLLVLQPGASAATSVAVARGLFDFRHLKEAGVILNGMYSEEHFESVKETMENHGNLQVFGYLTHREELKLESRHLGLTQSCENSHLEEFLDTLAENMEASIDLDELLRKIDEEAPKEIMAPDQAAQEKNIGGEKKPVIAVAKDEAFSFYYEENLRALSEVAEVAYFSPLKDGALPTGTGGIYFGGGYPEVFAEELSRNQRLREEIKRVAERGMPIFSECGGFMYLQETIRGMDQVDYPMVGIFGGQAEMTGHLQNFGYNTFQLKEDTWLFREGEQVRGHEFHRSRIQREGIPSLIQVKRKRKTQWVTWECGMHRWNVVGFYPHVYFPSVKEAPERFRAAAKEYYKSIELESTRSK